MRIVELLHADLRGVLDHSQDQHRILTGLAQILSRRLLDRGGLRPLIVGVRKEGLRKSESLRVGAGKTWGIGDQIESLPSLDLGSLSQEEMQVDETADAKASTDTNK